MTPKSSLSSINREHLLGLEHSPGFQLLMARIAFDRERDKERLTNCQPDEVAMLQGMAQRAQSILRLRETMIAEIDAALRKQ